MTLVETKGLTKKYGNTYSVNGLDMAVPEGSIYGFLGPNGAGKSTTLKMLLGLVHPTAGEMQLFGKPMNRTNHLDILKQVGSLIESPSYYGHLTGAENLRVVQEMRKLPASHIDEVLRIVRLEEARNKRVSQYSLGMKQRLGLAAALMGFPRLLILDEPTNGLDPAGIQEMRELIKSLPERYGMTVIVSSHLLAEIDQMADYVGIISSGELVFQDTMTALHSRSSHALALRTTDNAAAIAIIEERRLRLNLEGEMLLLPLLTDTAILDLGRRLNQAGIGILRLEERARTLEDIFLDLTKGGRVR